MSDAAANAAEAIARAGANAHAEWLIEARLAVIRVAQARHEFTTHAVVAEIPDRYQTHEPRALGAVMRWAAKQGLVESTGRYQRSGSTSNHNRPMAVWRSCVCRQGSLII